MIVTASPAAGHPDYSRPGKKVRCTVCFPALNEDESLAKTAEILQSVALSLHHLERYSIFEWNDAPTGDAAIDGPMKEIRTSGKYFKVSPALPENSK